MAKLIIELPHNITEYPNSFERQGAFPLERYSVFSSFEQAADYAQNNPVAYVTQPIGVAFKKDGVTVVDYYIIGNESGDLVHVGNSEHSLDEINQRIEQIEEFFKTEEGETIQDTLDQLIEIQKWINEHFSDFTDFQTEIKEEVNKEISRAKEAEEQLRADLESETERANAADAQLYAAIEAETQRANAADDELYAALDAETKRANEEDSKLRAAIKAEEDRSRAEEAAIGEMLDKEANILHNLIGEDEEKTVRQIANEELAAQLLSGEADASFKTLQELAAWLEDHPENAAAINQAIQEEKARAKQAEEGLEQKINSLDYSFEAESRKYINSIVQTDGQVQVTEARLPMHFEEILDKDETTTFAKHPDAIPGDTFVIKTPIKSASGKYYYTAYVFEKFGDNEYKWRAMDGNYNANNVYFSEDVTVTTTVGNKTTSNNTPINLEFTGKNLKEVYEYLYAKEDIQIAVTGTSATINLSKSSDSLEVGSTYTLPTASVSTGSGKYGEYGGKDKSGNKVTNNVNLSDVKFNLTLTYTKPGGSAVTIASDTNVTSITATTVPEDSRPTEMIATDSPITHKFNGTFTNTASAYKPITNLGNFVTAINSASAKSTKDYDSGAAGVAARTTAANMTEKSYTVSSFRKWYRGGDNKSDFSVATIKALTPSSGAVSAQTFELKAADYTNCSRIVIAIPVDSKIKVTGVLLKSSSNADITSEFKQINTTENVINIGGVDNYDPKPHNVWEYKPASLDSTEVYTITIG